MKKLIVVICSIALMFPLSASAYYSTTSSRLDALQLNVSIEDEANVIGLYKYGGNPAGIINDEAKSRIIPVVTYQADHFESKLFSITPPMTSIDNFFPVNYGSHAVYRTDDQAVFGEYNRSEFHPGGGVHRDTSSLGYNRKMNSFLLGADVDYYNSGSSYSDPLNFNIGMGHENSFGPGQLQYGFSYAKSASRSSSDFVTSESESNVYSTQAIYKLEELTLGGTISKRQSYSRSERFTDATYFNSYNFRGRLAPRNSHLQYGLSYSAGFVSFPGLSRKSQSVMVGPAYVSEAKNILGVEYGYAENSDAANITKFVVTGMEYHLTTNFLGRLSYKYSAARFPDATDAPVPKIHQYTDSYGVGLGYLFNARSKVDFSWRFDDSRLNDSTISTYKQRNSTSQLVGTIYF